jgi:hypothetical protein
MFHKCLLAALVVTAELVLMLDPAAAFDDSKYPNWSGQWRRPPGVGTQWDQTKPVGLAQNAPLTPEYQARLEASVADQARGGQGEDARVSCVNGRHAAHHDRDAAVRIGCPAGSYLRLW